MHVESFREELNVWEGGVGPVRYKPGSGFVSLGVWMTDGGLNAEELVEDEERIETDRDKAEDLLLGVSLVETLFVL